MVDSKSEFQAGGMKFWRKDMRGLGQSKKGLHEPQMNVCWQIGRRGPKMDPRQRLEQSIK